MLTIYLCKGDDKCIVAAETADDAEDLCGSDGQVRAEPIGVALADVEPGVLLRS